MINPIRSTSHLIATRRAQLKKKITHTKKVDVMESVSSIDKVSSISAIGLDAVEAIKDFSSKQDFLHEKYEDPPIYALPKEKRDDYKNDPMYQNEPLLLDIIINTISKSKIGMQLINVINLLKEKERIRFQKHTNPVHTDVFHKINYGTTADDILIVIAKDNTIENMAATLIHEVTHFMDIKKAIAKNLTFYRFETEANAIANSYRFYRESNLLKSNSFLSLSDEAKNMMEQFLFDSTGDIPMSDKKKVELLLNMNYKNLRESFSY